MVLRRHAGSLSVTEQRSRGATVDVEGIPNGAPALKSGDCDSAADTVVVRIRDEAGRAGIGEADAPAELVHAFLHQPDLHIWSQNVCGRLIGRDPFPIAALTDELYEATIYPGRRG